MSSEGFGTRHNPPECRDPTARPIVLAFVAHYLPGFKSGGPVRSIANLVDHLADQFDFRIFTSDRDAGETRAYAGVVPDQWSLVGKARVFYASPGARGWRRMARTLGCTPHDLLYLNSFFDPIFTLRPLLIRLLIAATPCIVAPRGELSPGALGLKARKKRLFMGLSRALALHRGITWHAAGPVEAVHIRAALGGKARIVVAADLPQRSTQARGASAAAGRGPGEPLRLVSLSRITPQKNLTFALEALARVRSSVRFDIYGVVEDESYWQHCRDLIQTRLPAHVDVRFRGPVPHSTVHETLQGYDLFFLPTRGESFGHAILEALTAGVPILISDQTPWRALQDLGVGWDLPLSDPAHFARVIDGLAGSSSSELRKRREAARRMADEYGDDVRTAASHAELFQSVLCVSRS